MSVFEVEDLCSVICGHLSAADVLVVQFVNKGFQLASHRMQCKKCKRCKKNLAHGMWASVPRLQWARAYLGYRWKLEHGMQHGTPLGQVEVLRWARNNGCPMPATACREAARSGHLCVLRWLVEECGVAMNSWVSFVLCTHGFANMLDWALAHGCPWRELECVSQAVERGHLGVLAVAHERASICPAHQERYTRLAARCGHVAILEWAHAREFRNGAMREAAHWTPEVRAWLDSHNAWRPSLVEAAEDVA